MKRNPYIVKHPVGNTKSFVGREDVINNVLNLLESRYESGMIIFGQRGIGKTSLLQALKIKLASTPQYFPFYFDLHRKSSYTLEQLILEVANVLLTQLDLPPSFSAGEDFISTFSHNFIPYILSRLPEDQTLVLMFDEFDTSEKTKTKACHTFYPYLRRLMGAGIKRLKLIINIGRTPNDLYDIYISFFKGLRLQSLNLFSLQETRQAARLSEAQESMLWPDDAINEIWELTSGHPFLTQQICYVLWEKIYDNDPKIIPVVQISDVKNAINEAMTQAAYYIEWIFNDLSPNEIAIISAIADAGPHYVKAEDVLKRLQEVGIPILANELRDIPKALEDWDMISSENDSYHFRVEFIRQWVTQYKPFNRIQNQIGKVTPIVEHLFHAAYGMFQMGDVKDAELVAKQAIKLEKDHLYANQLLADILMNQGSFPEALTLLEIFYSFNPYGAKSRLLQVLQLMTSALETLYQDNFEEYRYHETVDKNLRCIKIRFATEHDQNTHLLQLYEQILKIEPNNSEVDLKYQQRILKHYNISDIMEQLSYESNLLNQQTDAFILTKSMDKVKQIQKKLQFNDVYQQALKALKHNDNVLAKNLLTQTLYLDPSFEEATRFLYLIRKDVVIPVPEPTKPVPENSITENETIGNEMTDNEMAGNEMAGNEITPIKKAATTIKKAVTTIKEAVATIKEARNNAKETENQDNNTTSTVKILPKIEVVSEKSDEKKSDEEHNFFKSKTDQLKSGISNSFQQFENKSDLEWASWAAIVVVIIIMFMLMKSLL